jgi:DNA-directed RNA polymerase subunit RPC12/RpoP
MKPHDTYAKRVYVCGECHDLAFVFDQPQRTDRGLECVNCENIIWFDEAEPDVRLGKEGEDWSIDEYNVSDAFKRYEANPEISEEKARSMLETMPTEQLEKLHNSMFGGEND